jgi:hypothetical protein
LSWSLPWFGKDKTVLRAGYGINYQGLLAGGGGLQLDFAVGYFPGYSTIATHQSSLRELDLSSRCRTADSGTSPVRFIETDSI